MFFYMVINWVSFYLGCNYVGEYMAGVIWFVLVFIVLVFNYGANLGGKE